jgi:hypothetical protein
VLPPRRQQEARRRPQAECRRARDHVLTVSCSHQDSVI